MLIFKIKQDIVAATLTKHALLYLLHFLNNLKSTISTVLKAKTRDI